jgi:hypothetical protein
MPDALPAWQWRTSRRQKDQNVDREERAMKRLTSVAVAVAGVLLVAGAAFAYGPYGHGPGWMRGGMGPGGMGPGWMGPGYGGGYGPGACPMLQGEAAAPAAITEDEAKARAEEFVKEFMPGFSVEKVVPFQGRRMSAYEVEVKGPKGETRLLHVNPWGEVVPFRGRARG